VCAFVINFKEKIGLACVTKTMDLVGHMDEEMMDNYYFSIMNIEYSKVSPSVIGSPINYNPCYTRSSMSSSYSKKDMVRIRPTKWAWVLILCRDLVSSTTYYPWVKAY
jgi:hypothetical protein